MLAPLYRLDAVLSDEPAVVLAELSPVDGDRAALVPTLERGGTARVLGHDPNSC
jgi:hypothetical protein